jgi:hypothetical protein
MKANGAVEVYSMHSSLWQQTEVNFTSLVPLPLWKVYPVVNQQKAGYYNRHGCFAKKIISHACQDSKHSSLVVLPIA